ncbi:ABC transporter substrate-binding protein [Prauserella cavernicola]|uniref:ABC transporter substrate-binding protein n=1 Tax=Prauserella cavernicola TaxID=2800127 RepID=A0A934V1Q9_9PSEU|nr:ABC transporter substrate-binding protein [Prauserella cavernicola]MBK1783716.1 ABC transporter substrate-binding protein [Prauserella cavernicola]
MRRFRRTAALALAGLLTALTAGCGGSASGGTTTLVLGDQVKGLQTLLDASGVLEDTPYEVDWAQFQGAAPLFEAVKAGSVDTAIAADLPTLQAISGGVPVTGVAALRSTGESVAVVTQPGSPVRDVADLEGKDVVVSSAKGSIAEYLLVRALADVGLSYSDVNVRYLLPTDAQAAFSSGQIDVWATFGVYGVKALDGGARSLVTGEDGRTSGIGLLSAATASLDDPAKREAIADLLTRIERAYAWSREHRGDYVTAFAETNRVDEATAATLVDQGNDRLEPIGPEVVDAVQEVSDTMTDVGSLPSGVDVASSVETSLYPGPAGQS